MTNGLFGSTILDVAIGLFFIYLLLSLISSTINEIVARFRQLRAKDLYAGIVRLLGDRRLANEVLADPLIAGMSHNPLRHKQPWLQALANATPASGTHGLGDVQAVPSYIPAQTFSQALFETLAVRGDALTAEDLTATREQEDYASITLERVRDGLSTTGAKTRRAILTLINQSQDVQKPFVSLLTVRHLVEQFSAAGTQDQYTKDLARYRTLAAMRVQTQQLPDSDPRKAAVLALIGSGADDVAAARTSIEAWYDAAMERVSGQYKRRAQKWLFWIGLAVSVIVGADTARIVRTLYSDPTARAALVAEAGQRLGPNDQITLPITGTNSISTSTVTHTVGNTVTATISITSPSNIQALLAELESHDALFGYGDIGALLHKNPIDGGALLSLVLGRAVGILVTTIALALGAPFWYDVLSKLVNMRSTGDPPNGSASGRATTGGA